MINKYNEIRQVEQTDFTLNDIYLGYNELWEIMDEIEIDPEKITLYQKEVDTLHNALDDYIRFRSNYKTDLKELISE